MQVYFFMTYRKQSASENYNFSPEQVSKSERAPTGSGVLQRRPQLWMELGSTHKGPADAKLYDPVILYRLGQRGLQ